MNRLLLSASYVACLFLSSLVVAQSQPKKTYPGIRWENADAKALGWSDDKLHDVVAYAQSIGPGGLMIIDGGRVALDWGDTNRRNMIASVRKSLLSALYGIHVRAGRIDLNSTLDQLSIVDNAPSLSPTEKRATIRMLLQARSGIYHRPVNGSPGMQIGYPDRYSHAPGTFFFYNNWDFNALGGIFEQQLHTKIGLDFMGRSHGPQVSTRQAWP